MRLDRLTTKGRRNQFVSRAVLHLVETQEKASLRDRLKAEALANAQRDLAIAAEWFPLAEEAWQTFEWSRKPKKSVKPKRS